MRARRWRQRRAYRRRQTIVIACKVTSDTAAPKPQHRPSTRQMARFHGADSDIASISMRHPRLREFFVNCVRLRSAIGGTRARGRLQPLTWSYRRLLRPSEATSPIVRTSERAPKAIRRDRDVEIRPGAATLPPQKHKKCRIYARFPLPKGDEARQTRDDGNFASVACCELDFFFETRITLRRRRRRDEDSVARGELKNFTQCDIL